MLRVKFSEYSLKAKLSIALGFALAGIVLLLCLWSFLFSLFVPTDSWMPWYALSSAIGYADNPSKINLFLGFTFFSPIILIGIVTITAIQHRKLLTLYGDAHFATLHEIKKMGLLDNEGLIIGKKYNRILRAKLTSHALVFAPSRSGKGVSQVIPNALTFKDSMLVIDMKQEIFEATSAFRQIHGQKVFLFAPGSQDGKTNCWNPLDLVSRNSEKCISDLQLIIDVLIPSNTLLPNENSMWVEEARSLATGLLLWLMKSDRPFTLGELSNLIKGTPHLQEFLNQILKETVAQKDQSNLHPIAFRNINNFVQKAEKERSGVKSTLTARLNLWDDPFIVAATSKSDFDVRLMRKEQMSVYLGIPTNQLSRLAPLMNLFIQMFLNAMTQALPSEDEPYKVLAVLDEFCALGRMNMLKSGFGFLAGYHIHLMAIIQNVGQFFELYGGRDNCDTFFQNTDYKIAYRQNTKTDQEFISHQLGDRTVKNKSINYQSTLSNKLASATESVIARPLLSPDEVRTFPKSQGIALINGEAPVRYRRIIYYKDKQFKERVMPPIRIMPIQPFYPKLSLERFSILAEKNQTALDEKISQATQKMANQLEATLLNTLQKVQETRVQDNASLSNEEIETLDQEGLEYTDIKEVQDDT